MKLDKKVIEELAAIKASKRDMEKLESEMVAEIKKEMKKQGLEQFGPADCPYKLVFSEFEKTQVSWKDQAIRYAKKLFGKKYKKEIEKIEARNQVPSDSLNVELNEKYEGKAA